MGEHRTDVRTAVEAATKVVAANVDREDSRPSGRRIVAQAKIILDWMEKQNE